MTSEVSAVCAFSIDALKNTLGLIKDVDGRFAPTAGIMKLITCQVENECIQSVHDKCFIGKESCSARSKLMFMNP